jgi:carbon-monoxide dehydrogenase small subunit
MRVNAMLNGVNTAFEIEPHEMLLDVLRRSGCISVRRGCNTSSCGVCTVLIDGAPILSCSYFAAKIEGRRITTVEGLPNDVEELAEFMAGEGSEQCGYCNPGLALTVLAMKSNLREPTEETIIDYTSGNLCRCTGYMGQLRAIKNYLGVQS